MMCECDPGAQQVLKAHFPGVLLLPDVTSVQQLPQETELVAAGFPCIDVSRAGLRKGIHQGAVRTPPLPRRCRCVSRRAAAAFGRTACHNGMPQRAAQRN